MLPCIPPRSFAFLIKGELIHGELRANYIWRQCTQICAWNLLYRLWMKPKRIGETLYLVTKKPLGNVLISCHKFPNLEYINNQLNIRSDECGRVFVYRRDGTRFDNNHVQITDRSGWKSVPVWAWFSASGAEDFVLKWEIHGRKISGNSWGYPNFFCSYSIPGVACSVYSR